jgi:hypothetical protein
MTFGVSGTAASPDGAGVNGWADEGVGVKGVTRHQDKGGVYGENNAVMPMFVGPQGTHAPLGAGVMGFSKQIVGVRGASERGDGVFGSSEQGYGGHFKGTRAPLRLEPADSSGPPTHGRHRRGEFYVDNNGDLFFCKDDGTPGSWFKVQLGPA